MSSEKKWYHKLAGHLEFSRLPVGVAFLLYSGTLLYLAIARPGCLSARAWPANLVAITVLPPLWFLVEFNVLGRGSKDQREALKAGQELAGKLWAAMLAALIYFFPGGPLERLGEAVHELAKATTRAGAQ